MASKPEKKKTSSPAQYSAKNTLKKAMGSNIKKPSSPISKPSKAKAKAPAAKTESFGSAFASARKKHGGDGGTFSYKGKKYTTDTKKPAVKKPSKVSKVKSNTVNKTTVNNPPRGRKTLAKVSTPAKPKSMSKKGKRQLARANRQAARAMKKGNVKKATRKVKKINLALKKEKERSKKA